MIPTQVLAFGPGCDSEGICGSSHGFSGKLKGDAEADLYLFAMYSSSVSDNPGLAPSSQDAAQDALRTEGLNGTVTILSEVEAPLATLPGRRVKARIQRHNQREPRILDFIIAIRPVHGEGPIIYTLALRTLETRYSQGKRVLDSAIRSFRLLPLAR
jgi:hypothetical protein